MKSANPDNANNTGNNANDNEHTRHFKLPFIGFFSKITQRKLKALTHRLCTDLNVKLVFSTYKVKNIFSFKDPIPFDLKSNVVYQFTCVGCNSHYIGETTRHIATRIREHTQTDKNSHIFKHFQQSPSCKNQYHPSCFKIIDSDTSTISLKLKEALHIKKLKPELNIQVHHLNTMFSL